MKPYFFYSIAQEAADISRYSVLKSRTNEDLLEDISGYMKDERWMRRDRLMNAAAAIITEIARMDIEEELE